ncbi:MAG: InlB B-repeat-containing protein, partial [Clostridia bacterium]|nr:InlB B-repeat-containing protein [Clostridia bacterium]
RPESPVKETVGATKYIFEKWVDAEGNDYDFSAPVTSNVALKAVYSEEEVSYKVQFADEEGFPIEGIDEQTVLDGAKVVKPTDPIKESTAEYTYTFAGWYTVNGEEYTAWDFENNVVSGNIWLIAKFSAIKNTYDVTFVDENGSSLADAQTLEYGSKVTAPANPTKESTAEYTYAFAGWYNGETAWDFENGVVESDLTLAAKFIASVREYTLTINSSLGGDAQTVTYSYGDAADLDFAIEGYTFVVTLNGEAITELIIEGDVTIEVVYTEITVEESSSSVIDTNSSSNSESSAIMKSCKSTLTGSALAFIGAIALALIIKKRK